MMIASVWEGPSGGWRERKEKGGRKGKRDGGWEEMEGRRCEGGGREREIGDRKEGRIKNRRKVCINIKSEYTCTHAYVPTHPNSSNFKLSRNLNGQSELK